MIKMHLEKSRNGRINLMARISPLTTGVPWSTHKHIMTETHIHIKNIGGFLSSVFILLKQSER